MDQLDLLSAIDQLGRPRVLVVGDFMLDRYTWGNAERISQEAPVILLQADEQEKKLGGAANVCQSLLHLGADVVAAGVLGDDEAGACIHQMLNSIGVKCDLLIRDPDRVTTTKDRFMGRAANRHPHQILRVDREVRKEISASHASKIISGLRKKLISCDAILVSDYGKGTLAEGLLRQIIKLASEQSVPLIVDPAADRNCEIYRGATMITPNRSEAERITGLTIDDPALAVQSGKKICELVDLEAVLVTLDRDGMVLVEREGEGEIFPTDPRTVYDITGAGDMVLATVGLCLAAHQPRPIAAKLANVAAGLAVEQIGAAVIHRAQLRSRLRDRQHPPESKIVGLPQAEQMAGVQRASGKRIVFTNGCFDLLHVGHITYLQHASTFGDFLVVGLNSDRSVRQLKGNTRPVIHQRDRAAILSALQCVDLVIIFDEENPLHLIERLRPDVLVKGGDYRLDQVVGRSLVESYGGTVVTTPLVEGVSTTRILEAAQV